MAILTKAVKYQANHGAKFVRPADLPLYDKPIANNATTVVCICVEAAPKSQLNDYASYNAAKQGRSKFLCDIINEIWYNALKRRHLLHKVHGHQHHGPPQSQQQRASCP